MEESTVGAEPIEVADLDEASESSTDPRERSTIRFPYGSLPDAEKIAEVLLNEGGAAESSRLQAVLGFTGKVGSFKHVMSTSQIFGVVERGDGNTFRLTDLGRRIANPVSRGAAR